MNFRKICVYTLFWIALKVSSGFNLRFPLEICLDISCEVFPKDSSWNFIGNSSANSSTKFLGMPPRVSRKIQVQNFSGNFFENSSGSSFWEFFWTATENFSSNFTWYFLEFLWGFLQKVLKKFLCELLSSRNFVKEFIWKFLWNLLSFNLDFFFLGFPSGI